MAQVSVLDGLIDLFHYKMYRLTWKCVVISASKNNTIKAFSEMQTKVTKAVEEINKLKNNVSTMLYVPLLNENLQ